MPPGISREQLSWEKLNDAAYSHLGKEYDSLADILDDRKLNCVEYVWDCLKNIPGSDIWFSGLKKMIEKNGNLCPEMFYDCGSFEIVYEVRH